MCAMMQKLRISAGSVAAKLFSVLRLQHGNVRAVELVQARVGVDVDLFEFHAQSAQRLGHLLAEVAVPAPE